MKLAQASVNYKDFKVGTLSADAVYVYQSELTPGGPVYTVLGNYKLQ
jgi:2'-5' RNA ligase